MDAVYFAYTPFGGGDPVESGNLSVIVTPGYDVEDTEYSDINDNLRRIIDVAHKTFSIRFGLLTETLQNYFINMQVGSSIEFTYDSTQYDVKVESMKIRSIGATMLLTRIQKET